MKKPQSLIQRPAWSCLLPTALGLAFTSPLSAEIVLENNFEAETVGTVPTTGFTRVGTAPAGEIYQIKDESTSAAFGTPNKFLHVGGGSVRIATTIPGDSLVGVTRVTFDLVEPSGITGGSIIGFAANVDALDLNNTNAVCALNVNNGALSVRSPATRESGTFPALTQDKAYRMVFTLNYSGAVASYPDPSNPGGPALSLDNNRVALWIQDLDTTTWSGPVIITTTGVGAPLEFMFRNFSSVANELYVDNFTVDLQAASNDRVWDGGAGDLLWSSAANWENDSVPSAGNALVFGPAADGNITNDLAPDTSFAGLNFLPTAASYTIGGAGIVLAGPLVSDSSLTQTLALPIGLTAGSEVVVNDGVVNFNGDLSGSSPLKKTGAGTAVLAGSNTYTGTTTINYGTLEITGTNAGTSYTIQNTVDNPAGTSPVLKLANLNALPLTAQITGSTSSIRSGSVNLAVAGDYSLGSYQRGTIAFSNSSGSPASLTFANPSAISGGTDGGRTFNNSSADLDIVFADTLDIGSNTNGNVILNTTGTITVTGDVISTGTGTRNLAKGGAGSLTLDGASSYTGTTTLNGGVLVLGNANAIPGGIGATGGTSNLIFNSATAVLGLTEASGDFGRTIGTGVDQVVANPTEDTALSRSMGFAAFGVDRSVDLGDTIQLSATSIAGRGLVLGHATATHKLTIVNDIALNGTARTILVNDGSADVDGELSGVIASAGATLVKTGAGTLALTGTNTYGNTGGGTDVQAGVLMVDGDSLSDTSKLVLSGGVVHVTGTETVDTLFFGEEQKAAGTWGSSASSAEPAFQDDTRFSGTGVIVVTTGPSAGTGFDSWKTANGATGGINDDHDNDGVKNGVEYFIGGPNGNTTGFTALPGVTNTAGTLSITWNKGPDYTGTYGTDFVVETSETLTDPWTVETVGVTVTDDPGFVKYTFPTPLGTKKFSRLKVTGP